MARRTKVDVEVTDGSSAERFRFAELSMRGALRSAAGLAREDFCPLPLIPGQAPQLADWVGARRPRRSSSCATAASSSSPPPCTSWPLVTPDGPIDAVPHLKLPLAYRYSGVIVCLFF